MHDQSCYDHDCEESPKQASYYHSCVLILQYLFEYLPKVSAKCVSLEEYLCIKQLYLVFSLDI